MNVFTEYLEEGEIVSIEGHKGLYMVNGKSLVPYPEKVKKSFNTKSSNKPAYAMLVNSGHFGCSKIWLN